MNVRTMREFQTQNVQETIALGALIGAQLTPNAVIALVGTLGSGKTHLVKGIAQGNNAPNDTTVNSPTFVIVNEYPGDLHLYHIDAYRLSGTDELQALGFEEMCLSGGAVLVEWADKVTDALPEDHLSIAIEITSESSRQFTCLAHGEPASALLDRIMIN